MSEQVSITLYRRTYRMQGGKILQSEWSTSKKEQWDTTLLWEEKTVWVNLKGIKKVTDTQLLLHGEFLRQTNQQDAFDKFVKNYNK